MTIITIHGFFKELQQDVVLLDVNFDPLSVIVKSPTTESSVSLSSADFLAVIFLARI